MGIGNANYVYWQEAANSGAPFVNAMPVISGPTNVFAGEPLTTTNGTVFAELTVTFSYQWMKDSVAIAGATANTYALVTGDIGGMITCVVSAVNTAGRINTVSNSLGPITA